MQQVLDGRYNWYWVIFIIACCVFDDIRSALCSLLSRLTEIVSCVTLTSRGAACGERWRYGVTRCDTEVVMRTFIISVLIQTVRGSVPPTGLTCDDSQCHPPILCDDTQITSNTSSILEQPKIIPGMWCLTDVKTNIVLETRQIKKFKTRT